MKLEIPSALVMGLLGLVRPSGAFSTVQVPGETPYDCANKFGSESEKTAEPIHIPSLLSGDAGTKIQVDGRLWINHLPIWHPNLSIGPGLHCPIFILSLNDGKVVATAQTDERGRFSLLLPSDDYYLATDPCSFIVPPIRVSRAQANSFDLHVNTPRRGGCPKDAKEVEFEKRKNESGAISMLDPRAEPGLLLSRPSSAQGILKGRIFVQSHGAVRFPPRSKNEVVILAADGSIEVARTVSDANGDFELLLAPGRYTVFVPIGRFGVRNSVTTVVSANRVTLLELETDTGLKCLPGDAMISGPSGETAIRNLHPGALVWTKAQNGTRTAERVVSVRRTPVPVPHTMVHLLLSDGRQLTASPSHPLEDGRLLGMLHMNDSIQGAVVVGMGFVDSNEPFTYDILVEGNAPYMVSGFSLRSTLEDED